MKLVFYQSWNGMQRIAIVIFHGYNAFNDSTASCERTNAEICLWRETKLNIPEIGLQRSCHITMGPFVFCIRKGFESTMCFLCCRRAWNSSSDSNHQLKENGFFSLCSPDSILLPTLNHSRKMRSYRYQKHIESTSFRVKWNLLLKYDTKQQ